MKVTPEKHRVNYVIYQRFIINSNFQFINYREDLLIE